MKKNQLLLTALLFIFAFMACDSNDNNGSGPNDDAFAENFGNVVSKDFIGQVIDTDNHPIQNAAVTIGTTTVQTDVNGVFIINGVSVHEKFAYIRATKAGYIDGSRAMVPTSGKNNVKIMLIPNTPTATVQSGVESEVSLPLGTKVSFDGEFEDESGNSYSGSVSVALFHLLPSNGNIDNLMPGMLYAQTKSNQEAVLATYGMLNVELRGSGGQKLNIKEGHTAEITMKIDDSQLASAPNLIPLWHFDEAKGYWKEDGVATKVGNTYVGEVSHFSWWNCDMPNSSIRLTFTFVDSDGSPLSNVLINLVNPLGYHASGSTDSNGQLSGILPANQVFTLNVYGPGAAACGGIIYTVTIGPYAVDTVVPTITLSPTVVTTSQIVGTLLKCDNTNVTNGYVLLNRYGSHSICTVTNGTFSFNEIYCGSADSFTLEGADFDNLQTTGIINYMFTSPVTSVGVLTTCNTVTEFISYQIDSNPPVMLLSNLSSGTTPPSGTGQQLYINANVNSPTGMAFYLNGSTHVPGIYGPTDFSIYSNDIGEIQTNTLQYNLSSFGAVGQYVDMAVSGTYTNFGSPVVHTLTVTAHLLRDY